MAKPRSPHARRSLKRPGDTPPPVHEDVAEVARLLSHAIDAYLSLQNEWLGEGDRFDDLSPRTQCHLQGWAQVARSLESLLRFLMDESSLRAFVLDGRVFTDGGQSINAEMIQGIDSVDVFRLADVYGLAEGGAR